MRPYELNQSPQSPMFTNARFRDIDQLSVATQGWDLDFRQLDSGICNTEIGVITLPSAHLMRFKFNRSFHQAGAAIEGFRSFAILERGTPTTRWCGRSVTDSSIQSFPPAGGFEAISKPQFQGLSLSYKEEKLAEITEILGVPSTSRSLGNSVMSLNTVHAAATIRSKLHVLYAAIEKHPKTLEYSGIHNELENDIPAQLMLALMSRSGKECRPTMRARDHALKRALSFIEEKSHEPPTVLEICQATGVSWRTLNYAFRDRLGITPKRYLIVTRLNAVHRDLLTIVRDTKVADVANRWGFWHMGQFAAEYRRHFSELPSDTLKRRLGSTIKGDTRVIE